MLQAQEPTLTPTASHATLYSYPMSTEVKPSQFIVNKRGKPTAVVLSIVDYRKVAHLLQIDKKSLEELEEDLEARSPRFLASLEASRKSGRVSAHAVKRKTRLL